MKKSLFMMGVAIAALSSCTQNEVLDIAESNTIQFGNSYIGKPTRANIINAKEDLNSFYVFGYQYKESAEAMWKSEEGTAIAENVYYVLDAWKYNNIKKYDKDYSYFFAAYSNAGINGEGSGDLDEGVTANFSAPNSKTAAKNTLSLTIDNYSAATNNDLLVAISGSDLTDNNQIVSFGFKHALSQVNFILKNPLGNNPIVINSFSVTGLKDNGKLTYMLPQENTTIEQIQWDMTSSSAREIKGLDVTEANETQNATGTYTVIPQNQEALTVNITATLYKNGETGAGEQQTLQATIPANSIPEGAFKPGYIYNFNATLNMGYIYFDDITVEEWVPSTPDTELKPEVQPGV